jgi:hypothetical protein
MEPFPLPDIIFGVAGVALVAALVVHGLRVAYNLRIIVRGERVTVGGTALSGRRAQIAAFFRECLPDVRRAWVIGRWDGRRLSLRAFGLTPAQTQRLRNFLLTEV